MDMHYFKSQNNSCIMASRLRDRRLKKWGSTPEGGKDFYLHHTIQTLGPYSWVSRARSLEITEPNQGDNH
jgi:hypothetical protein